MASELKSLNNLPDEIVLKILSHFGPEELCLVMAKVCAKWNILAKDTVLWKTLSYTCDRTSDINRIAEVLTNAPALHSLIIHQRKDVARILEFPCRIRGSLRKLVLKYCSFDDGSTGLLANIVTWYPDLEVLSVGNSSILSSAGCCLIPRLKKLSELSISICEESGKTVRLVADGCQHLKKLNLDGMRLIDDDDVIYVIKKLGKQLTTLVLDGQGLTDVAYLYLNNCARLKELGVSFCENMTDRALLEGIGSLQELTHLRLNESGLLSAQALSTFLHQPSMTSIVSLDLSFCFNLDDEGLKGIAERCVHLKELAVCQCFSVTDAGISMVIRHCNQLRVLNLRGILSITGEGYLALVPSHLPHLRQLWLVGCKNVCDKYVDELMAAVPELKVIGRGRKVVRLRRLETGKQ